MSQKAANGPMSEDKIKDKTAKKKTLVTLLLDRSGSMEMIKDDTLGAINAYLGTLRESGEDIRFSLVTFTWAGMGELVLEKLCVAKKVSKVAPLTSADFIPRGGTPLRDAIGTTIEAVEASLVGKDNVNVVMAIQTDGQENRSTKWSWEAVKALISAKEEEGWEFLFMGAGINAYEQGSQLGISAEKTLSYGTDQAATRAAFEATAANTVNYASGLTASMDYSCVQKASAGDDA